MNEDMEVEENGGGGITNSLSSSPPSPLPPSKRIVSAPVADYSKKTRDLPNFSDCHRCGVRQSSKGAPHFLRSNWRIALLCKECLAAIASAEACSYCFSKFAGADDGGSFVCRWCRRRVHPGCIPAYHLFTPPSGVDRESFACMDCCPYVKPRVPVEDVTRVVSSGSQYRAVAATRVKENIPMDVIIALPATSATHLARSVLDGVFMVKETATEADEDAPDENLDLQPYQVMNGSPRRSGNLGSRNSEAGLKNVQESDSYDFCGKVEVCTEDWSFFELTERIGSSRDSPLDAAVREEQGSCSGKVENSRGDDIGSGFASVSGLRSEECNRTMPLKTCAINVGQDSYCSQQTVGLGAHNRYSKKYSKKTWRLKGMLDMKECQIIQCSQMSCSEASKPCSDAPSCPQRTPMHCATCTSSLSGCNDEGCR